MDTTRRKTFKYFIEDLGCAAYLYMQGFTILKATGRGFFFKIQDERELHDINAQKLDFYNSQFARFDQCLMTIKKLRAKTDR